MPQRAPLTNAPIGKPGEMLTVDVLTLDVPISCNKNHASLLCTLGSRVLEAFWVKKSRTTAYHPQGDGLIERFNLSLLQLLRSYVDKQDDWEKHLSLVLYAQRSSVHSVFLGV